MANYSPTIFTPNKPTITFIPTTKPYTRVALLLVFILIWPCCHGYGTFGFRIHHRFSDPVTKILDAGENLPEKGTGSYYAALAHSDRVFHGRRLSTAGDQKPLLTFSSGNSTYRLNVFGYLHYANVTVGTPGLSFLVALDTGSDLFWLPCDCESCVKGVRFPNEEIDFDIYSLSTSSTGKKIPCNSSLCGHHSSCSTSPSTCPYRIMYLSANTSSSGYLVEDTLHLIAENNLSKAVDANIPFGCGKVQTGSFLDVGAPNGLLGLGLDSVSVPSMLASENITTNSFSMCFGDDGLGRITFGDQGSSGQGETPFNLRPVNPHYNVSITQIAVGSNVSHIDGVYAIFDSGTSFTYLNDPAYTLISANFDSQIKDRRHTSDDDIPFEYCYDLSSLSSNSPNTPNVNLTMHGGDQFDVINPTVSVTLQSGDVYCLGIVKSENVNIIGQNFMTGYRVVFDRERMVLGWKASSCYEAVDSSMLPISPQSSKKVPPISSVEPVATSGNTSHVSGASSTIWHHSSYLYVWTSTLIVIFLHVFSIHLSIL